MREKGETKHEEEEQEQEKEVEEEQLDPSKIKIIISLSSRKGGLFNHEIITDNKAQELSRVIEKYRYLTYLKMEIEETSISDEFYKSIIPIFSRLKNLTT